MGVHIALLITLSVGQMLDIEPIGFEVNRDGEDVVNGEKLRVLYSRTNDKFFQLQESISECSTFIDDQIMKGKNQDSNCSNSQTHHAFFFRNTNIYCHGARPNVYNASLTAELPKSVNLQRQVAKQIEHGPKW